MSSHHFERLLAPLPLRDFVRDYWERQPVHIHGSRDKFRGLMNRQGLLDLLRSDKGYVPTTIGYLKAGREEHGQHVDFQTAPERAESLLAAGYTIQIEDIDRYVPLLRELMVEARRALSIPARMNVACFLSPAGSGYGLHFDASAMWVMQLAGRKRWWHSPAPAVEFPMENSIPTAQEQQRGIHGYRQSDLIDIVLSPGDVLYLPAGVWHRVQAVEESLHLCLSLFPATALDLFTDLLRERVLGSAEWRRPLNCGLSPGGSPEDLDREVERVLSLRVNEMRAILDSLRVDEVLSLWRRQVTGGPQG